MKFPFSIDGRAGPFWGSLTAAVILWSASLGVASVGPGPAYPPFVQPEMEEYAVQDMSLALNGARRLGADLGLIQLLQYYGTAENAQPQHPRRWRQPSHTEEETNHHDEGDHHAHNHIHLGDENSAESNEKPSLAFWMLAEYALRTGSLDPRFHFVYLFSSGALAFNLNRTEEAMRVLQDGVRKDPTFWRYRLYQGGIAYRKNKEVTKVIANLEEAFKDPECPSIVKNILAHIYIREGNPRRAAEIYINMLESRDPDYADHAKKQLRRLGVMH